ncbi:MAG TPA: alpha/beta hydrolase [Burkholderiales bacterium]|nr:alpha/beta hydrolase [Burkholderiales bacterium]
MPSQRPIRLLRTATLEIAYEEYGVPAGAPVILLHGFPDDPRVYDGVVTALAQSRFRLIVPYLRGYGPTRFLDQATLRSGQQAALGKDLLDLMDGLSIPTAILGGYDWGGRAACVVAALWPERARGLVTICGYNIQNIAQARNPANPDREHRLWYQWYFQTERGRAGLAANRRGISRLLWELWSPNLRFDDATFGETAASFANPDFVDVVIHSYRHRFAAVPGDPALEEIERRLAARPAITVPTVSLHGASDGVHPPDETEGHARFFSGRYRRQVVPVAGHFLPREAPDAVAEAIMELAGGE